MKTECNNEGTNSKEFIIKWPPKSSISHFVENINLFLIHIIYFLNRSQQNVKKKEIKCSDKTLDSPKKSIICF